MNFSSHTVSVPVSDTLCAARAGVRNYLARQIEWSCTLLPIIQSYRTKSLDKVMRLASLLGSEEFYVAVIPLMTWIIASPHVARICVMLFGLNMGVGNFLKNSFALPRPSLEYLVTKDKPLPGAKLASDAAVADKKEALSDRSLDARDFGWPSVHSINATTLPFFILRCVFGSAFIWTVETPVLQMAAYAFCLCYTALICFSRMYLGVHSPADVQGGMLLGALQLRVWLAICEGVDATVMGENGILTLFGLTTLFLLLHPKVSPGTYTQEESVCLVGFVCGYLAAFKLSDSLGIPVSGEGIYTSLSVDGMDWSRTGARVLLGMPTLLLCKELTKLVVKQILKVVEPSYAKPDSEAHRRAAVADVSVKDTDAAATSAAAAAAAGGDSTDGVRRRKKKVGFMAVTEAMVSEAVGESCGGEESKNDEDFVQLTLSMAIARYIIYFVGYGMHVTLFAPLMFRALGV